MSIKIIVVCDLCGQWVPTDKGKAHAARGRSKDIGWANDGAVDVCQLCIAKHGSQTRALRIAKDVK